MQGAGDWVAAQSAGISLTTYCEFLRRGRAEASGPHRDLFEAVERASGEAYLHAVVSWRQAMRDDWRASVAYIDRVDRARLAGGPPPEGPAARPEERRLDPSKLSDEQLAYLEGLYDEAEGEDETEEPER